MCKYKNDFNNKALSTVLLILQLVGNMQCGNYKN